MEKSDESLSTRVAELEQIASEGDTRASKKLTEIEQILSRKKRGRPSGSKTTYTDPDLLLSENISLASYGAGSRVHDRDNAVGGLIDQIHHALEAKSGFWGDPPDPESLPLMPIEKRRNLALEIIFKHLAPLILAKLEAKDFVFFDNLAAEVKRRKEDPFEAFDPRLAALLSYVGFQLSKAPDHKFNISELDRNVKWPRRENGQPDRYDVRTMRRKIARYKIPLE